MKRSTKDSRADKGKDADSPFPVNINPSKSQEQLIDEILSRICWSQKSLEIS